MDYVQKLKENLAYQMFFKVKNILCQCDFEEKGNLSENGCGISSLMKG